MQPYNFATDLSFVIESNGLGKKKNNVKDSFKRVSLSLVFQFSAVCREKSQFKESDLDMNHIVLHTCDRLSCDLPISEVRTQIFFRFRVLIHSYVPIIDSSENPTFGCFYNYNFH